MVAEARQPVLRTRRRAILAASIGAAALVIAGVWTERRELAGTLIDRRLADAGVPAAYRILTLGPTVQVLDSVRIGDPARPDFVARRVVLHWRYRLGLPQLAAIEVDGGRLRASWRERRLSLGAIDRLVPQTGSGSAALPDLDATLHDTALVFETPVGTIRASIEGAGNLANGFRGIVRGGAPSLAIAGCTARGADARLAVRTAHRAPHIAGPVDLASLSCRSLRLDPGRATIDLALASTLDRVDGTVALAGFGGRVGGVTFDSVSGRIAVAGGAALAGETAIALQGLRAPSVSLASAAVVGRYRYGTKDAGFDGRLLLRTLIADPKIVRTIDFAVTMMRETPLGPIAARLGGVVRGLASGSDIDAPIALTSGNGTTLRIERATIRTGAAVQAIASARLAIDGAGWQAQGDLSGPGLSHLTARVGKAEAAAPVDALVRMAPYRAGSALLALSPLRVIADGETTRFATTATLDGPLGSGAIEGLVVPLAGTIDRAGGLALGNGCTPIRYRRVRLGAMTLDPGSFALCGTPLVSTTPQRGFHLAAIARDLVLTGRSGAAPVMLRAASLRLTEAGFSGTGVATSIGAPDDPTHLAIRSLDGRFARGVLAGGFGDAAGAIGHVPLALSGATGAWRFDKGALHLTGGLRVADRADVARFLPLATRDVALALVDGRISATGTLQSPARNATVARIAIDHDLASGSGGATLTVPGITFARGALQPEMLTPLTLGVVANVAGTVQGSARIDWTPRGTTSSGTFATDRLDLAAAFGPVVGIAGTIRFTDLLGLVTAPHQEARIAEINPGVAVADGVAHYQLIGADRVRIEDARWPFAGGTLALDPATLDFAQTAERRLTFRVAGLDAGAFLQQLDFPNISATGTFDGRLPMVFDATGGRIEDGALTARGPGTLAYVGELSNAQLGTMGKLAFDALKAIRYSGLEIALGGNLDGEIVTRVHFDGVRQAAGDKGLVARMIRNLPFRFNIQIRAPFRGLVGSARSYANPALLLQSVKPPLPIQPAESAPER